MDVAPHRAGGVQKCVRVCAPVRVNTEGRGEREPECACDRGVHVSSGDRLCQQRLTEATLKPPRIDNLLLKTDATALLRAASFHLEGCFYVCGASSVSAPKEEEFQREEAEAGSPAR